jgi:hypothetical protein
VVELPNSGVMTKREKRRRRGEDRTGREVKY